MIVVWLVCFVISVLLGHAAGRPFLGLVLGLFGLIGVVIMALVLAFAPRKREVERRPRRVRTRRVPQ